METVDIVEAAEILKVDRKCVEELIHSCAISAAVIGRRYVMMRADVVNHAQREIIRQTAERMRKPTKVDSRGRSRAS